MRSQGLLYSESDCASNFELCSKLLKGIDLEATLPKKKVSYMSQGDSLLISILVASVLLSICSLLSLLQYFVIR
jgi:hypothetical protein